MSVALCSSEDGYTVYSWSKRVKDAHLDSDGLLGQHHTLHWLPLLGIPARLLSLLLGHPLCEKHKMFQ